MDGQDVVVFVARHYDSNSQHQFIEQMKQLGARSLFADWHTGVTKVSVSSCFFDQINETFFRVIKEVNGKPNTYKESSTYNKVKRSSFQPESLFTYAEDGHPMEVTERYTWECTVCNRVWRLRIQAQTCKHTDECAYRGRTYRAIASKS